MSGDTEALKGLLAKVEAATGPDRRLDYEVFSAFAIPGEANPWDPKEGHFYTASVDAALALVEQSGFAGFQIEPCFVKRIPSEARIRTWEADEFGCVGRGPTYEARAATPPLAILGSLLKALIAQDPTQSAASQGRQGESNGKS